jgi:hypothetical protein
MIPIGTYFSCPATGYFGALAVQSCILRRMTEGGGYMVSPSLTGTAMAIVKHFKADDTHTSSAHALGPEVLEGATGMGWLKTLRPLPVLSVTPTRYEYALLVSIGSSIPAYPGEEAGYDVHNLVPRLKHNALKDISVPFARRMARLAELGRQGRPESGKL